MSNPHTTGCGREDGDSTASSLTKPALSMNCTSLDYEQTWHFSSELERTMRLTDYRQHAE